MASSISVDTSLLAHALIPGQQTLAALHGLAMLREGEDLGIGSASVFVEFPSLLRRFVNQGRLDPLEAEGAFTTFLLLHLQPIAVTHALVERSWEIAGALGQSDTFDAMGYAVAEQEGGEFWTCDQRFANAARQHGLASFRYFD